MFTADDYHHISDMVFQESFRGYEKSIQTGYVSEGKRRHAHVAPSLLRDCGALVSLPLGDYIDRAHRDSVAAAIGLGIPKKLWPSIDHSVLRVLEYPTGTATPLHTDDNMITVICYRNIPENFYCHNGETAIDGIVFGDLIEALLPDNFQATPHEVLPDAHGRTQYSIVYFANPHGDVIMPDGNTVGDWISKRKKERSTYI